MLSIYDRTDLIKYKLLNGKEITIDDLQFLLQFPKQYVDEMLRCIELKKALSEVGKIIYEPEVEKGEHASLILPILIDISD